ncbi:hypothetical protein D3C78_1890570 [compost metagenome]
MGEAFAMQHHITAARTHTLELQGWRGGGHDDSCLQTQMGSGQGDALSMVAGRSGDHAALALGCGQAR